MRTDMVLYVGSNWGSQARIRKVRDELEALGHQVRSSWLDETDAQEFDGLTHPERRAYSYRDLGEIATVDVLILDTTEESVTGGREVEAGFALGLGKPVWRVGPERNIFHATVQRAFESWNAVFSFLDTLACQRSGA